MLVPYYFGHENNTFDSLGYVGALAKLFADAVAGVDNADQFMAVAGIFFEFELSDRSKRWLRHVQQYRNIDKIPKSSRYRSMYDLAAERPDLWRPIVQCHLERHKGSCCLQLIIDIYFRKLTPIAFL
jgi:hypothetical protein